MTEQQFAIGKNIRLFREIKGFSQDYMANKVGVSQRTYSNIEADKSKVDTELIKSIAEVLEIDPIRLLSFDEKVLFQNGKENNIGYIGTYHHALAKESDAQKEHIKQLKSEVEFLRDEVKFLRTQLNQAVEKK